MWMDAWRATRMETADKTTDQGTSRIDAITGRATGPETSREIETDTITSRATDLGTGTMGFPMVDTRRLVRISGPAAPLS